MFEWLKKLLGIGAKDAAADSTPANAPAEEAPVEEEAPLAEPSAEEAETGDQESTQ